MIVRTQHTTPLVPLEAVSVPSRLVRLYDIVRSLNSIMDLNHLLISIVASAAEMMNAHGGAVLLLDDDCENLTFVAASGGAAPNLKGIKVPVNERSIAGYVAKTGVSVIENDTQNSPFFSGKVDEQTHYVTRKLVCVPLKVQYNLIGVVEVINKTSGEDFNQEDIFLLEALADVAAIAIQNSRLYEDQREKALLLEQSYSKLKQTHEATMQVLAGMLDMRDDATHGHSRRVVTFTLKIAEVMGVSDPERLRALEQGALLHDVGKIGISDAVLRKPSKLNEDEWQEMKRHPELGYRLLKNIEFLEQTLPTVRHHHEHWDGSGYPTGLSGEEIPIEARIFAVADAFDALTSDRPYSPARTFAQASAILQQESGTTFDPEVVSAFLSIPETEWDGLRNEAMSKLEYASSDDIS